MKHTLTAAALSLAIAAAASGAATAQVWQGDLFLTKTAGCSAAGDDVGDFGQAVFSPAATNGASDHFALFGGRGTAMQITPSTGPLNGATSFTVTEITHTAGILGPEVVTTKAAGLGPFTVSPVAPTAANQTVAITGTVKNFASTKGCDVTLNGTLFLRPGK